MLAVNGAVVSLCRSLPEAVRGAVSVTRDAEPVVQYTYCTSPFCAEIETLLRAAVNAALASRMTPWRGDAPPFYPSSEHTAESRELISEIIPSKLYLTNKRGVTCYAEATKTLGQTGDRVATHMVMVGCDATVPGSDLTTWSKELSDADDQATLVASLHSGAAFIHAAISDDISAYAHDGNHDVRPGGGCVIVLCASGISRSASVVIGYLILHAGLSLRDAFARVFGQRGCVWPSEAFMNSLVEIEHSLYSKNTLTAQEYEHWAEWEGPAQVQGLARRMSLTKGELAQLEQ